MRSTRGTLPRVSRPGSWKQLALWALLAPLGGLAASACATDAGTKAQGPVVHDIEIVGTKVLSQGEIKDKILTAETGWWPFATKRHFDPADWQTDLRRIERLYETHGYYAARVVRDEVIAKDDKVDLKVFVEENQPVHVAGLSIAGLDALPPEEQKRVTSDLPIAPGAVFREEAWSDAKGAVNARLRNLGHASATLDAHALVDVGTETARLRLTAAPGPRYTFGDIDVKAPPDGNVDPDWIAEQVRLAVGWDKVYSDAALDEAQKRVFGMNVFSSARVTVAHTDPIAQRISLLADVRESPMHTLRLGGGGGIDQVRQEVRAVAEWTNRNFHGGLRRLQTRAMVGWAFIPDVLAVLGNDQLAGARQGAIYKIGVELEQPRLLGRPSLKGKTLLESERSLEQTYDAIGARTMAGVSWQPRSSLTLFPSYNLLVNHLSGPNTANAQSAPLTLGCQSDPCFVWLSYLEEAITRDTRDSALEPRRGHYLSLSLQEGGGPLGGDFTYLRVLPEVRAYTSVGHDDRFTFAGRFRVGSLLTASGQDSAVVTRFYAGGSLSMRGFGVRRLSPMLLVPTDGYDPNDGAKRGNRVALPIGGNGIIEGSGEARMHLADTVLMAAFVDFGSVTRDRFPLNEIGRMSWAVGLGFRFLTPIGPLRFDLGFRLPVGTPPPLYVFEGKDLKEITYEKAADNLPVAGHEDGTHVDHNCFGIGGAGGSWVTDGLCAFHLSIGEAF
jgi:translocation and assembly module TamA